MDASGVPQTKGLTIFLRNVRCKRFVAVRLPLSGCIACHHNGFKVFNPTTCQLEKARSSERDRVFTLVVFHETADLRQWMGHRLSITTEIASD